MEIFKKDYYKELDLEIVNKFRFLGCNMEVKI